MKKIFLTATFITIFIFMLTLCSCAGVSESPAEDFTYEMSDGEIIITGYTGTDLSIRIPSSINDRPVTVIGEEAFEGYDMTDIVIPDSVVEIGNDAFSECNCLTSIKFSKNLKTIGTGAFSYCDALTAVALPNNLKTIGKGSFSGCKALTTISFPKNLEYISDGAFEGSGLKTVSLPKNLKYLGADSFAYCTNLDSLTIPDNTDIEIVLERYNGQGAYVNTFRSPVGGSYTRTMDDSVLDALGGIKEYEQLHTKLIVSENSYAYEQVKEFMTGYGLTVEVK